MADARKTFSQTGHCGSDAPGSKHPCELSRDKRNPAGRCRQPAPVQIAERALIRLFSRDRYVFSQAQSVQLFLCWPPLGVAANLQCLEL